LSETCSSADTLGHENEIAAALQQQQQQQQEIIGEREREREREKERITRFVRGRDRSLNEFSS